MTTHAARGPAGENAPTRVLHLEDSAADAEAVAKAFEPFGGAFSLVRVERLGDAVRELQAGPFDVVVSDLNVPDSKGLDTFHALHRQFPEVPVIVVTGLGDESVAIAALRHGAQDYLVKGSAAIGRLSGNVRYAIERQRLQNEVLRDLSRREKMESALRKCGTAHLWQAMFRVLGGGASVILHTAGEAAGGTTYEFVMGTYAPKDDESFARAIGEHFGLAGLFIVRDLRVNREGKAMQVQIQRSFEAAVPRRDPDERCHFLRGLFSGVAARLFEAENLTCDEVTCEARGAEVCTFAVRPVGGGQRKR